MVEEKVQYLPVKWNRVEICKYNIGVLLHFYSTVFCYIPQIEIHLIPIWYESTHFESFRHETKAAFVCHADCQPNIKCLCILTAKLGDESDTHYLLCPVQYKQKH